MADSFPRQTHYCFSFSFFFFCFVLFVISVSTFPRLPLVFNLHMLRCHPVSTNKRRGTRSCSEYTHICMLCCFYYRRLPTSTSPLLVLFKEEIPLRHPPPPKEVTEPTHSTLSRSAADGKGCKVITPASSAGSSVWKPPRPLLFFKSTLRNSASNYLC